MPTAPRQWRPPGMGSTRTGERRTREQVEYRKWYRRAPWAGPIGIRARQLAEHPLCEERGKLGHTMAASVVDHKHPHRGNYELFID